ncbi:CLUMA_CG011567, isoform A [Clunio marinus]|uniref:Polypeptide N-acetylgalactosaminyltransferase n=1 Tax=Clunio marinus TaxID=568069 RepID=A0A1J1IF78_9DIPT|nr:CLUMA_CG011567, isoform A [Clunio marinus]
MKQEVLGPGENGEGVKLIEPEYIEQNLEAYNETGFSVLISDMISLNRTIVDFRADACKSRKYLASLPNVSVIIIFRDEVKSVLLRTVHGVINRTPSELLHEIILVNDNSTHRDLYRPLQIYVRENFPKKVKIVNLKERKGLIVTRLEGARRASGKVLVFFDSHVEVGINWLPPLLDPIARNRRLATVPVIDNFDPDFFSMSSNSLYGTRAGFDWNLIYRIFERNIPEGIDPLKPFPNPIMLGCAFAIDRIFFLDELGGYDEEFRIWNGENYELSFKLWLCADGLYEVPCSRVAHSFRRINPTRVSKEDFLNRNFKRLTEVWMDEFKNAVYSRNPEAFAKTDAGDLTKPKEIRSRLNCKPFKYFLEEIAPEITSRFPLQKDHALFASGQIKSLADENICLDTLGRAEAEPIGLYACHPLDSNQMPPQTQFFRLSFLKNLVLGYSDYCLDSWRTSVLSCSGSKGGNQYWKYNPETHMLINGYDDNNECLTAVFSNQSLTIQKCDKQNQFQKWKFSYENETALNAWNDIYGYGSIDFRDYSVISLDSICE